VALSFNLADLFVTFTARGAEALAKTFEGIEGHLKQVQAGATAMSSAIESTFGRAKIALLGFVTAGVATSVMGEVLSTRMGFLTREIASLFIPQLQALVSWITRLTDWFRSLSAEQQHNLGNWLLAGAAVLAVAKIMPILINGIMGTVAAVRTLTVAIVGLLSGTGFGALLPVIGAAITALTALFVGTEIGRKGISGLWAALQPTIKAVGDFLAELKPLGSALAGLFDALGPLFKILADIGGVIIKLLVPVFQILASVVTVVLRIITPIIDFFVKLARVIVDIVLVPLKAIAWIIEQIAKGIAFLTGTKLDLSEKIKPPGKTSPHESLAPRATGFESLQAAWERVARSTLTAGLGKRIDEQQLDVAREQLREQQKTNEHLGKARPVIVP